MGYRRLACLNAAHRKKSKVLAWNEIQAEERHHRVADKQNDHRHGGQDHAAEYQGAKREG